MKIWMICYVLIISNLSMLKIFSKQNKTKTYNTWKHFTPLLFA